MKINMNANEITAHQGKLFRKGQQIGEIYVGGQSGITANDATATALALANGHNFYARKNYPSFDGKQTFGQ